MAVRPQAPRQGNIASTVAVLVLAGCFVAPVLAVTPASHEVTSNDSVETTATTIDSVAADHLLKPRVEATAREVFAESASVPNPEDVLEVESADDEIAEPRLRRMSENELVPFRRQMYRKDI